MKYKTETKKEMPEKPIKPSNRLFDKQDYNTNTQRLSVLVVIYSKIWL